MTSKFIGRTKVRRVPRCSFCDNLCLGEQLEFTHKFSDGGSATKILCSMECLLEEMGLNDYITKEVERRTRREHNWLHKQVCPRCRARIISRT
jgi:hypothetical protein